MPRKIDRDRRKAELAEAVWRIIRERGLGAVSVRSVADEAGVAVGSLRHVFPTRTDLLVFSAELTGTRATERVLAVPWTGEPYEYALRVATELLPLTPDSRGEMEVDLALIAEAPALPGLVAVRDEAHSQVAEVCTRMVELLVERPDDADTAGQARRLHVLIDGLALHLLMLSSADGEWAIEILRAELARIARGA